MSAANELNIAADHVMRCVDILENHKRSKPSAFELAEMHTRLERAVLALEKGTRMVVELEKLRVVRP